MLCGSGGVGGSVRQLRPGNRPMPSVACTFRHAEVPSLRIVTPRFRTVSSTLSFSTPSAIVCLPSVCAIRTMTGHLKVGWVIVYVADEFDVNLEVLGG